MKTLSEKRERLLELNQMINSRRLILQNAPDSGSRWYILAQDETARLAYEQLVLQEEIARELRSITQ